MGDVADDVREAWVDLFWIPLGAGGHVVRWNGRLYEWCCARHEHRRPTDLYHSGLMLWLDGVSYAVEMGPVWNVSDPHRGVLVEGPVGSRTLGRFRAFRYELRCWREGLIPDIAEAVDSPVRVTEDPSEVEAVLEVLGEVPALTWGRDELRAGDMWNSNSAVAWALARTAQDMARLRPPAGGRAPGWQAGLVLAQRQAATATGGWDARSSGDGPGPPLTATPDPVE